FTTLMVGNLSLILANRSWKLSIFQLFRQRKNPSVKWILAGAVIVLMALVNVAALRRPFGFGPMTAREWLISVLAGLLGIAWFEIYKLVRNR
ncbi:MAG: cation-translocating P-type ATPase C-terminal domain-containing protein, partial [Actinomycetota bacterium]|nr:cation-translocating P-type ATPase C-terminal domain-containing protein [Actinomycetota bacterium]